MMTELIIKTEEYVFHLFKEHLLGKFLYHDFLHTQRVVDSAKEIAENLNCNDQDTEIILLAAWLHDTGYIRGTNNHEEASKLIADTYLTEQKVSRKIIDPVLNCIQSTKPGVQPQNILEEILKDADNSHFAKKYFLDVSELLRQEQNLLNESDCSATQWRADTIAFMTDNHRFYTSYAIKNWKQIKHQNLLKLFSKNKKIKKKTKEAKVKAGFKNQSPERGIQTLFRVSLRNHIKLSDIADTKANILLSVNAIIISLALANLIPKLDSPTNRHLMIPSLILVLFSVASIILSIMSTSPKVTRGEFTDEDVEKRRVNLLFFGNFHKMPYLKYQWAVNQILNDKAYIYNSLTKDLYYLGVVLNKKYKLLKITYWVFMTGIITSVLAFVIAFRQL